MIPGPGIIGWRNCETYSINIDPITVQYVCYMALMLRVVTDDEQVLEAGYLLTQREIDLLYLIQVIIPICMGMRPSQHHGRL